MNKKWIILSAGIVLIAAASYGIWKYTGNDKASADQIQVRTTQVRKGEIKVTVSGSGNVSASEMATVQASAAGTVAQVLTKAGDTVKKGQKLVVFEAKDMSAEIKQQQLDLESKRLDLVNTQNQLKDQPVGSNTDSLMLSIKKTQLAIDTAVQNIADLQEEAKAPDPIVAPIDGTLTTFDVSAGGQLNTGTQVAQMTNYGKLEVTVQVDELDIPQIKVGQEANITLDALPNQKISGKVTSVAQEGSEENGVSLFDVKIGLDSIEGVKAGMSAQTDIIIDDKKDILMLPVEAVRQIGERYMVAQPASGSSGTESGDAGQARGIRPQNGQAQTDQAQNGQTQGQAVNGSAQGSTRFTGQTQNGQTQMKEVKVGFHNETWIEITEGLKEGDVVTLPGIVSGGSSKSNQTIQRGAGMFGGFGGGVPGGGFQGSFQGGGRSFSGGGGGGSR